jgi:glycosyltransferase involved in cell wall biosynthesis
MAHICMVLRGDIRYDGRVRKEIATLVRAGHEIDLVVSDFRRSESGGEDLAIKIHYVPATVWPSAARNFFEQLVFNRKAASVIRKLRPSHIHCHDLSSLLAGVWAKKELGATLVFDAHELMPESMGGIREAVWGRIERKCLPTCDHVIMPEKNRIAYFKRKYPGTREMSLLENFPRRTEIPRERQDLFRRIYPIAKDQKVVLYTGLIAARRHVEELIDSMAMCGNEFVLVLLGRSFKGYEERLRERITKTGLEKRVFLHDAVPHAEILTYMAAGDIGTAFYSNTNVNDYYCASNKLFEYIALEKPVLTNAYPGLLQTVEKFSQGVCLKEINPKSLSDAYITAIDSNLVTPGSKKFFWEDEEHILLELYDEELARPLCSARV